MSDSKDVFDLQCRLCTSTEKGQLQIFGSEGLMRHILDKIKDCLPVTVRKDDPLPKWVCHQCAEQLDQFHLFRNNCSLAESKLEQCLKEASDFALEPECCLQEVEPDIPQQSTEIKPVNPYDKCLENGQLEEVPLQATEDSNGLTIVPVVPDDQQSQYLELQLGSPAPDDYVLMKEETFRIDGCRQTTIEESVHADKDSDIVKAQKRRREILPPMWDVYERPSTYSTLVTHRRYIVNKAAFPCSLCNKCFSVTQGYQRDGAYGRVNDEGRSSGEEGSQGIHFYSCHVCWKVFPKRSSLKRHQRMHADAQTHVCPSCGKVFGRKEHLSRHMISHTGGRPYSCELCSKPFMRKEHLDRHRLSHCKMLLEQGVAVTQPTRVDEVPTVDRPFPCDICLQMFPSSEQLARHQKRMHSAYLPGPDGLRPKLHSCTVCSKLFTRKEHLVRHLKVHQRESPQSNIVLALNDTSLLTALPHLNDGANNNVNKDNDIKHFLISSALQGLAEVKVEGVETTLDESLMKLDGEMTVGTEKTEFSQVCEVQKEESGRSLLDKSQLSDGSGNTTSGADGSTDGSLLDTSGGSMKPHPCPCCKTKSFSRKSHLVRHFKRAHPDQPLGLVVSSTRNDYSEVYKDCVLSNGQHLCKICGKIFGRRYHLIRHMKLHRSGEVPSFHCSACKDSFLDHQHFQSHVCNGRVRSVAPQGTPDSAETSKENRVTNVNGELARDKMALGKSVDSLLRRGSAEAEGKTSLVPATRDTRSPEGEVVRAKVMRSSSVGRGGARKRSFGYRHECVTCGINFSKKKLLKRHSENAHGESTRGKPP